MRKYIVLIFCSFITLPTFGQISINKISLDYGITNNYQFDFGNNDLNTFAPEIKIGGNLLKKHFEWDFLLSFWNDDVNKSYQIMDAAIYSYSSQILGLRFNYFPKNIILPIHFICGISTRFIQEKHEYGSSFSGLFREDNSFNIFTFDFGLGLDFKIVPKIRIRLDGLTSLPFNKNEKLYSKGGSYSLKLGLDYFFR